MGAMNGIEGQGLHNLGSIHSIVSDKINIDNSSYKTLVANLNNCTNENVERVTNDFMKDPAHSVASMDFMGLVSLANRCEKTRNASIVNNNNELFLQAMSFLNSFKESFSPDDLNLYNKLSTLLNGKVIEWGNKNKDPIELDHKYDKNLWGDASPLFVKYGNDISKNITAFMLNQCIDAWCSKHEINDREQALKGLNKVFNYDITHILSHIDYLTDQLVKHAKPSSSPILLRHSFMSLMSAIRVIPVALKDMKADIKNLSSVPEKINVPDVVGNKLPEPMTLNSPGSPNHITVTGGNVYVPISDRSASSVASPTISDPWSAVTDKLLASDKITTEKRNELLKELIVSMGGRREIIPYSPHCCQLLNRLDGISNQEIPSLPTSFNDEKFTHITSLVNRDVRRQPNQVSSTDRALQLNTAVMQASTKDDSFPIGKNKQIRSDQVNRQFSTHHSIESDMSTMPPPQLPLNNVNIGTLSSKQNINPLASLASYRQPGADLSVADAENRHAVNDGFRMAEAVSSSDLSSSVKSNLPGINSSDLALLKHWLKDEVKENENETAKIDKLVLHGDGLYTQTMEYFLERAFLLAPGSESYSDMQQNYINAAFLKVSSSKKDSSKQSPTDLSKLSSSAHALVNKYVQKRSKRVFTTISGLRRSLSPQMSCP